MAIKKFFLLKTENCFRVVFGIGVGFFFFNFLSMPVYSLVLDEEKKGENFQPNKTLYLEKGHKKLREGKGKRHVPGEVLVKFKKNVIKKRKMNAHVQADTEVIREIPQLRVHRVKSRKGESTEVLLKRYLRNPNVEYAEPNVLFQIQLFPNDPFFSDLYGLHNTGQTGGTVNSDIKAVEVWDFQVGDSAVIIADIDTGVDYTHPDLLGNMWANPGEIPGNGIDDDGNGFIDDFRGWDFYNMDNDPMDDHGHGTHTAGTIAAEGNNGLGVVGVTWKAKIMPLKFLNSGGSGSSEDAALAIIYAADMGAKVASNSWGCGPSFDCFSQTLEDAIEYAQNKGMLFVAAAGNAGNDNDMIMTYPCTSIQSNVVCVAATDDSDKMAFFSSFGANTVDLGAPGVNILSTVPTGSCVLCDPSGYISLSGTSMATPHVSGVAALIFSAFPSFQLEEIKENLLGGVDSNSTLAGKTVTGGRLNAEKALNINFLISSSSGDQMVLSGESITFTITVASLNGFSSPVTLNLLSPDPTITGTFDINPIIPPANGSADITLTVSTSLGTARGNYSLGVQGRNPQGEVHTFMVHLNVFGPDFTISVNPYSQTMGPNGLLNYTISVTSHEGYSAPVALSQTAPDPALSGNFSPSMVTPPPDGTVTANFTLGATPPLGAGNQVFTIRGDDGIRTRSQTAEVFISSDLTVLSLGGPSSAAIGDTINIIDLVMNQGIGTPKGFYVTYYLSMDTIIDTSDIRIGSRWAENLSGGATQSGMSNLIIPERVPVGSYHLGAIVDSSDIIFEDNENNNAILGNTVNILPGSLLPFQNWHVQHSGPKNAGTWPKVVTDPFGNIVVSGEICKSTDSHGNCTNLDIITLKYNSGGGLIWEKEYDNGGWDYSGVPAVDGVGNVYVAGSSCQNVSSSVSCGNSDILVLKYDPNGTLLWLERFDAGLEEGSMDLIVDSGGNLFLAGNSDSDYITLKYNSNGQQIWVSRYDHGGIDFATSLWVDPMGNVLVTGISSSSGSSYDYATIKYDNSGNQVWVSRYDNGSWDEAWDIWGDANGNVYVTGQSCRDMTCPALNANLDMTTIKYNSNGNPIWVSRYDHGGHDWGFLISGDNAEGVYVTGPSENGVDTDYTTLKYDFNGNQIWVARLDNDMDVPMDLKIDSIGNVYVTGKSCKVSCWSSSDFFTVKYDKNANQIWVAKLDKEAVEGGTSLGVDDSGDVYVAGLSEGDVSLLKYTETLNPMLTNISTRGYVGSGASVMIGGFIIDGDIPKTVLVRAMGPTLADFGISGLLNNPNLQLFSGSSMIAQNNDWQNTDPMCGVPAVWCGNAQDIMATGLDPCTAATTGCKRDSAIYITLPPGAYTAIVSGVGGGTGVGLMGVFDIDENREPRLGNISTRGFVGSGGKVMIGGFIIGGNIPKTVLVRAMGPTLAEFGISGSLNNPNLHLFSGSSLIAQNNNWQTTDPLCSAPAVSCGDDQDIIATGLDPCSAAITGCGLDSAIYITLPPGAYTAIVSGVNNATGVGLVGVFDVN